MKVRSDAVVDAPEEVIEWTKDVYDEVDSLRADGFAEYIDDEDGEFVWANLDPMENPDEVERFLADYFSNLEDLEHEFTGIWATEDIDRADEVVTLEAEVTYTLPDDSSVTVPANTNVERVGDEIGSMRIYADLSPLSE